MAKEISGFFDSVGDDRIYQADEFARRFRQVITDGVRNGGNSLRVTAPGTGMTIEIDYGDGMVQGYDYWLIDNQTGKLALAVAPADSQKRIDRAVLRLDMSVGKREVYADIVKGTPGTHPAPPDLQRDNNIYELSLARFSVDAGATIIKPGDIIDERYSEALCGIMNSLFHVDYEALEDDMRAEFDSWIGDLQEILDEEAAGNLLGLINALTGIAVTSNTARVIHVSTADADGSLMAEGDIWIKHE